MLKVILAVVLLCVAPVYASDYAIDTETGYRMERYRAPVPSSFPGGTTVDTAFIQGVINDESFSLIDVYPPKGLGPDPIEGHWLTPEVRKSLPGAVWLPDVGRGYLEAELEAYFQRNLEHLSAGDKNKGLVFFCTSDCWQSWNAAVRANRWGYTNVHWYPTGSDGWVEQGGKVTVVEPVNFLKEYPPQEPDNTAPNLQTNEGIDLFPKRARILLYTQNGSSIDIGHVVFKRTGLNHYGITVTVESPDFNDHFLSMRPFKCLDGASEWFCHQPYPYELSNVVSKSDVTDLEYQLLFIKKTPKEFGIDAWNGLYFRLAQQENGIWRGDLLEGDLNPLQSPPTDNARPLDLTEFIEADITQRRFTHIELQPTS